MYKKIAFTLILVFSLFITKDAFASVIISQTDDTGSYNMTSSYPAILQKLGTGLSGDLYSISYKVKSASVGARIISSIQGYNNSTYTSTTGCSTVGLAGAWIDNNAVSNTILTANTWENKTDIVKPDIPFTFNPDCYYRIYIQEGSPYASTMSISTSSTDVFPSTSQRYSSSGTLSETNSGTDLYFIIESAYVPPASCTDGIQNQDETGIDSGGVCSPLVSGIDKVSLYTLNNEDLSEITTPIPFDSGHQIHFFNYEEDSYQYLAYNMTICHNGHLEGCTVNNETFVENVINISSLGFSSSGEPPLSVKINFKDVVSQSDLINITWFLTNCNNAYSTCPEGVSEVRGYTYLINNSLASDSWLTFDDPARPECSISRLDVCLINAVNYFIKPRTSGFANSFSVAHTRINERIPFVYLYAVRDAISDISNSPSVPINWSVSFGSVGSLTVLDSDSFSASPYYSFFTGMRVYLSYLLWILLGVGLYKRAVRLFDDKTVA